MIVEQGLRLRADLQSYVELLLPHGLAGGNVEAAVIDRSPARGRTLILHKQHDPAGLGRELLLVMWISVIDHRAGVVGLPADRKCAFEDVPDLRVPMHRMVGA